MASSCCYNYTFIMFHASRPQTSWLLKEGSGIQFRSSVEPCLLCTHLVHTCRRVRAQHVHACMHVQERAPAYTCRSVRYNGAYACASK